VKISGIFGAKSGPASRVRVKICGITNEADALAATEAGADALGFNLVRQSKRYIDIETAAGWIAKLPAEVCKVAVMANPSWEDTLRISRLPFIDALQLHGNESPEFCRRLAEAGIQFVKALPVVDSKSLLDVPEFSTDTVILDSVSDREFGGSGKVFSWKLARQFVDKHPKLKVILAGGLNPKNVVEAVREACPDGVDVTTGVEASPGRKDHGLVRAFVQAARRPPGVRS
jgi:phosphoribosylanthranilate isomerase